MRSISAWGVNAAAAKVREQAADAQSQRFLVGVQKAGADHALGDFAGHLDGGPLVGPEVEPALNGGFRQEVYFLYRERDVSRFDLGMNPAFFANKEFTPSARITTSA